MDCYSYLPPKVLVIHMSDVQGLGGESVRLNLHIRTCHFVHETRLSHVGETGQQQCTCVGVDRWKTRQMLTNLCKGGNKLKVLFYFILDYLFVI